MHTHISPLLHEGLENQLQVLRAAYQAALLDSDDGVTVTAYACANCYNLLPSPLITTTTASGKLVYADDSCNCLKPLGWPLNAVIQKLALELARCDPHIEDGR